MMVRERCKQSETYGGSRMQLTVGERARLEKYLSRYKRDSHVQMMKQYIHHGKVTTYDHCMNVTCVSFWMNRRLRLGADEKALAVGAFLHDFYLYDWHKPEKYHRLHGYFHADVSMHNAVAYFHIGKKEQEIIHCHMWPLNITRIPRCREAAIVCFADKVCSALETVAGRRRGLRICG